MRFRDVYSASLAVTACNLTAMSCHHRRSEPQSVDVIDPCLVRRDLFYLAREFAQEADQLAAEEVARMRPPRA